MRIALAQIDIVWENFKENIEKIKKFAYEGKKKDVTLILFPEMSLSGFTNNLDALAKNEDEIVKEVIDIAIKNNINIGLGFAIKVGNKGKNKFVIVSRKGKVLSNYTKIHPFTFSGEDKVYDKGNTIDICDIEDVKFASFICYDLRFPEIFQVASKKAQVITVAANWPKEREDHWITLLRARAIENQCYVLGINRVGIGNGLEYSGASIFVSPNGKVLNEVNSKEEIVIRDIDIALVDDIRNSFDIKKDRREDLYSSL
ncbi:Nitrilase/cyanide hydratase and apolipoprotein N-acyltransferase [Clostridium bornimense]|uniref:Nitrilase/cyanide hydratase and apolipoprotein N-acyltransferase n=1 Tax=Clostridium bornimense TaxID=1216932 RepID=W6RVE4_9CLOT|nr:carbon-nitrogen family hydrolase [Clostridium bornimense]CDM67574.1 Nitrilase/cyanide hydratase and apolipoprotein N-acyltransferase [Clostridium bornimense]